MIQIASKTTQNDTGTQVNIDVIDTCNAAFWLPCGVAVAFVLGARGIVPVVCSISSL